MKRQDVETAADLICKERALRAKVEELQKHKAVYITVDQRTKDNSFTKIGFDADLDMANLLSNLLDRQANEIAAKLVAMGVEL